MSEGTITIGELGRSLERMEKGIDEIKIELKERPTDRDVAYLEDRVRDLESWQTWAMRLGVPGLGAAAIALLNSISNSL